jgi:hypothetical protein
MKEAVLSKCIDHDEQDYDRAHYRAHDAGALVQRAPTKRVGVRRRRRRGRGGREEGVGGGGGPREVGGDGHGDGLHGAQRDDQMREGFKRQSNRAGLLLIGARRNQKGRDEVSQIHDGLSRIC